MGDGNGSGYLLTRTKTFTDTLLGKYTSSQFLLFYLHTTYIISNTKSSRLSFLQVNVWLMTYRPRSFEFQFVLT